MGGIARHVRIVCKLTIVTLVDNTLSMRSQESLLIFKGPRIPSIMKKYYN